MKRRLTLALALSLLVSLTVLTAAAAAQSRISSISPTCTAVGSHDLVLTVYGSGFMPGDSVLFMRDPSKFSTSDMELKPSYLSSIRIRVTVPETLLSTAGKWHVVVFRPTTQSAAMPHSPRPSRSPRLSLLSVVKRFDIYGACGERDGSS